MGNYLILTGTAKEVQEKLNKLKRGVQDNTHNFLRIISMSATDNKTTILVDYYGNETLK